MASIFVSARNRSYRLLHTAQRRVSSGQVRPSLVVVGMGTAGVKRSWLFCQRMAELSAVGRIQTAVFYDCNETTISHVQKRLLKSFGAARAGGGMQVVFPNYIPLPNGFMCDPTRFEEYRGPLERDVENIINQVSLHAERCGRAPETILEFMSFSGHSVLGAHLHRRLVDAFPNAVALPILMLPRDHASQEWTRRYIWEQYENLLSGASCLVTSPSSSNSIDDDTRLATGLAGFEVAEFADESDPASSQLSVTFRRLEPFSGGWLGMAAVKRQLPLTKRFRWLEFPPWWRDYAAIGPEDEMSVSLGNAIWSTFDPAAQLAEGMNHLVGAPQEIVVSLPVHPDELEPVASQAAETLERTSIFDRLTNLDMAFTTARFSEGIDQAPYMHVARIYPVRGELPAVTQMLHPHNPAQQPAHLATLETGFGSYQHLHGVAPTPLLAAEDDELEPEEDWRNNVRYF